MVFCSHYAHVGLLHFAGTHPQKLACLQHTEQPHLGLQRQLTHFVQKQRTAVGYLEIALVLALRVRKRTFLMSEKLAVYRSLGDSAAVHGEIRTVFAGREGVYNLREMLFTHTGFSGDQYTSPVISTLRSVRATCTAISMSRFSSGLCPIIPKRCLIPNNSCGVI